MKCQSLPIHSPPLFEAAVQQAAALLRAGEVVALPTETVYGLAANAWNASAVARIFSAKGRPPQNPVIVHVGSLEMARACVGAWPEVASQLARAFWPGPLTLVLPKAAAIPDIVTAGGSTVGVRWPWHPFTQAVIQACGFPLAAPSANRSGEISPTQAGHVLKSLGGHIPLIVDAGPTQVGLESTVLDLTVTPPEILRPGMVTAEAILAVTGQLQNGDAIVRGAARSPGLLAKHYAPKARLAVLSWADERELAEAIQGMDADPARTFVLAHGRIPSQPSHVSVLPHEAEAFARALYAELHRCDEAGAQLILVETPPGGPEWTAIHDRLKRAACV